MRFLNDHENDGDCLQVSLKTNHFPSPSLRHCICPILVIQNVLHGHFRFSDENSLKICIVPPKLEIYSWAFVDLVTLDGLGLAPGHRSLRMVLRSVSDVTDVDLLTMFLFDEVIVTGEDKCHKSSIRYCTFYHTCDIGDAQDNSIGFPLIIFQGYQTPLKFCKTIEYFSRFGGPSPHHPPPPVVIQKYSSRARVSIS